MISSASGEGLGEVIDLLVEWGSEQLQLFHLSEEEANTAQHIRRGYNNILTAAYFQVKSLGAKVLRFRTRR